MNVSNKSAKTLSILEARLKRVKEAIIDHGYEIKDEKDPSVLLVGFPDDYFCVISVYEDQGLLGVGFDLTSHPQDVAVLTLAVNSNAPTGLMQPHYHAKDGKTYFGDAAFAAFDRDVHDVENGDYFGAPHDDDDYDPEGAA